MILPTSVPKYNASWLASLSKRRRDGFLKKLDDAELVALAYDWSFWARRDQLPPKGKWHTWLVLAGRGWGKTRTGAEWAQAYAQAVPGCRLALVAETIDDARHVMVEGESGLLACAPPWARPEYAPSKRLLTWPNGSSARYYSAEDPEQLRGPQFHAAWCDEVAKWRYTATWDNLLMGLRLGQRPQKVVTTTPRPTPLIKQLLAQEGIALTRGSTYDNAANLADGFLDEITTLYSNTRLGQQELYGDVLEASEAALWRPEWIESQRRPTQPADLQRIIIAIDPAMGEQMSHDETGLIVAGRCAAGHLYVLADASGRYTPKAWAERAVQLFHHWHADRVIAEVNNGGSLVETVLRQQEAQLPYTAVHASRGKQVRAEPIAALYEQGRVSHVGCFPELEEQLCAFDFTSSRGSPDRLDALVWALSHLALKNDTQCPRVRTL